MGSPFFGAWGANEALGEIPEADGRSAGPRALAVAGWSPAPLFVCAPQAYREHVAAEVWRSKL